ncbi:AICARFT/IMPCHase bienzyme-domain-containing protein [Haematococcus lacustris]
MAASCYRAAGKLNHSSSVKDSKGPVAPSHAACPIGSASTQRTVLLQAPCEAFSGRSAEFVPFAAPAPLAQGRRTARRARAAHAVMAASKRALISLSDKTDLEMLVKGLAQQQFEIVSTGGTAAAIQAMGVPCKKVEELTGFPEMLDGRVKTLHPAVHGGILAIRSKAEHMGALDSHKIAPIDLVVVNLYPFRKTVTASPPPAFEEGVENIDIGGPTMIRAAAKNMAHVTVVVDPADYPELLVKLAAGQAGPEAEAFRKRLAWKAFQHCSSYDAQVSEWLWSQTAQGPPPMMTVPLALQSTLRYGENPHQSAAFYTDQSLREAGAGGVATSVVHWGKEMSYNNYLDADAAYQCCCDYQEPSCVIVKHTNPCGVASRADLREAYRLAVRADPISAFGGIVAFNRPVDADLAREIREFRSPTDNETRMFYEIVIAPSYTPEGLEVLKGKSKNLRILEAGARAPSGLSLRQVAGGMLWQDADSLAPEAIEFKVVSETAPTPAQLEDLKFAWRAVKHVKSNAITVAKDGRLLGMGSGQPNRVNSVRIALEKAGAEVQGAVLASDAFFPFSWNDSVELACKAGVAAIVHPGGSLRDQDAVECCNKYGVALMVTGVRHFKH